MRRPLALCWSHHREQYCGLNSPGPWRHSQFHRDPDGFNHACRRKPDQAPAWRWRDPTVGLNLAIRAGADELGRALVFAPDPIVDGSSISHWDPIASRNLLMEPPISGGLTHSVIAPEDTSLALMRDIGWFPDADLDGVPDENDSCLLNITTTSLPAGVSQTPYSQQLSVLPAGSYTFSIVGGTLPSGITLNAATGLISGLSTVPGTYNIKVQVQKPSCSSTRDLSIAINCAVISLNPATLPGGQIGSFYSQAITATPPGSYSYSVSGTLPSGLALQPTGVLSGVPNANGTFNFTVTATGAYGCAASRAYTVIIEPGSCPIITLSSVLPNGKVGKLYIGYLTASPAGVYARSLTGTLPPGLTFYGAAGLIFGYPTTPGPFSFSVTATNPNGCTGTGGTIRLQLHPETRLTNDSHWGGLPPHFFCAVRSSSLTELCLDEVSQRIKRAITRD